MIERPAETRLGPVLDFLRLLWDIEHRLQSTSKHMRVAIGVTGQQRLVLRIVSLFPDMAAGQLADVIRLHPSTITGIVQRLVSKGLLTRATDPGDSRRVRLRVRSPARPLTRRADGTVEAAVKQALAAVPAGHVKHARAVLTAIASALGSDGHLPIRSRTMRRVHTRRR